MGELTKRQQEVLALLCWGFTTRAIARSLGLAEHTVKAHLTEVYKRLGVANRTGAVVAALTRRGG